MNWIESWAYMIVFNLVLLPIGIILFCFLCSEIVTILEMGTDTYHNLYSIVCISLPTIAWWAGYIIILKNFVKGI